MHLEAAGLSSLKCLLREIDSRYGISKKNSTTPRAVVFHGSHVDHYIRTAGIELILPEILDKASTGDHHEGNMFGTSFK